MHYVCKMTFDPCRVGYDRVTVRVSLNGNALYWAFVSYGDDPGGGGGFTNAQRQSIQFLLQMVSNLSFDHLV